MRLLIVALLICCFVIGCDDKDNPPQPAPQTQTQEPQVTLTHLTQLANYYDKEIDDLAQRVAALEKQVIELQQSSLYPPVEQR